MVLLVLKVLLVLEEQRVHRELPAQQVVHREPRVHREQQVRQAQLEVHRELQDLQAQLEKRELKDPQVYKE